MTHDRDLGDPTLDAVSVDPRDAATRTPTRISSDQIAEHDRRNDKEAVEAIGLRLEIDSPTRIDGFFGLLGQIAKASLLAGESSVTVYRAERSVRLDTSPLELFDFSADKDVLRKVVARAHYTTMLFFGQEAAYRPIDDDTGTTIPSDAANSQIREVQSDLLKSIELRRKRAGCVFDPGRAP
jgi:hypothetical protein